MPDQLFHGLNYGFGIFGPSGDDQVTVDGVAFAVGAITNIDDFEDPYEITTVQADVTHVDGTKETFAQMFPGTSTVPHTEHREVLCKVTTNPSDIPGSVLPCIVIIRGKNLVSGLPYGGSWGLALQVIEAP